MKKVLALVFTLVVLVALCIPAAAANLTEDKATHGEWVGNYGKDGYIIFNSSVDTFTEKLPGYVKEFTYSDLYDASPSTHSWWTGTDGADLTDPAHAANALWEDESKASRRAPCIYNGEGLMITVDTGDVTAKVSFYSLDWDDNGRVMLVTMYDAAGNEVTSSEVGEFLNGVYVSAEVTGKATFEFTYLDAVNMDSPSNAVISGVFFDSAAAEEVPAADTAEETAVVETAATVEETIVAAPQTFDSTAGIIAVLIVCGISLTVVTRKK